MQPCLVANAPFPSPTSSLSPFFFYFPLKAGLFSQYPQIALKNAVLRKLQTLLILLFYTVWTTHSLCGWYEQSLHNAEDMDETSC